VGPTEWPFGELAGVIDLACGKAVHAIAGERASYQPVQSCGGNPVELVKKYHRMGIRSFYIADLDAITGRPLQTALLDQMVSELDGDVLVDVGWSGLESAAAADAVSALAETHSCLGVIAATETAYSTAAVEDLAERVGGERVCLGLDFRNGQFLVSQHLKDHSVGPKAQAAMDPANAAPAGTPLGNETHDEFCDSPRHWIDHALALGIQRLVILDIAKVGKQVGTVTGKMCCEFKKTHPQVSIWSGGGIRNASDAYQLIHQGCDRCLIATALHRLL